MQASNATVWLAGDFNAPNIDWETMTLKNNHAHTQTYNSLLTRIAYDHGPTTNVNTSATMQLFYWILPARSFDWSVNYNKHGLDLRSKSYIGPQNLKLRLFRFGKYFTTTKHSFPFRYTCCVPYAYFIPYTYGTYRTRELIWYDRTRMVWLFVPYACVLIL